MRPSVLFRVRGLFAAVAALLLASSAPAKPGEARAAFYERHGERFRGTRAVPAAAVDADHDFERAKGQATWFIALPVDDDDRVRFLEATIRGGRFQKGTMHTFGFKEERITAARFEKLRKTCPMLALRAGSAKVNKKDGKTLPPDVTVHAPLERPVTYRAPAHPAGVNLDPVGRTLGHFRGGCTRLGVDLSTLRYEVTLVGPEKVSVVLGVGTASGGIPAKTAEGAIRAALEKKSPNRRGAVSDRDVADFYGASTVRLNPVSER